MLRQGIRLRRLVTSVWSRLAIAGVIIWLLIHFNRIDLKILVTLRETWPWLLAAFSLMLPPFLIISYRFKVILFSQGIDISFQRALHWTMVGAFFDLVMPSSNGGDLIKAAYLVGHVGVGLRTRAVMAVTFDRIIGLLGLFLLATIVGVFGWNILRELPASHLIVGISFAAGVGPLIVLRIAGSRRLYNSQRINHWLFAHSWGAHLRQFIGSFNALRENHKILFIALGLSMLNHIFWCTSLLFIAIAVGSFVPPLKGFVIFPLAIFGGVFGVAGGFGVGTAAFDFLLSHLLSIQNGALIGLLFQCLGAITRLFGLPFVLTEHRDHK